MASIDSISFTDTYDMPIRHPVTDEVLMTDDGQEMFIRLGNPNADPEFKKLKAKYRNEQLRGKSQMTAEKEDAKLTEMLVTLTKAWLIQGADGLIKHSTAAARSLYSDDQYHWIRTQAVVAAFDETNFAGESLAA